MVMSEENKQRARERFIAMHNARRLANGLPPLEPKQASQAPQPAPKAVAQILEIELTPEQLAALSLDSRCKRLPLDETVLALINKAYGL